MIWATTSTLGHAFTLPSCGRLVLTRRIRGRGADLVIRVRTIKVARVVDRAWPVSHVNIYTSSSHSASTPRAILCNAGSRRAKGVLSSTPQFLGKVKCMGSRQEKKREEKSITALSLARSIHTPMSVGNRSGGSMEHHRMGNTGVRVAVASLAGALRKTEPGGTIAE